MTMAKPRNDNQAELVPTAHVKFTGMSGSALDTPPDLGDVQEYLVRARCIGVGTELRKDGEVREIRRMEVENVDFREITKATKEKGLFAVPGESQDGDDDGTEV